MSQTCPTGEEIVLVACTGVPATLDTVRGWMRSADIEVLGALHWCLTGGPGHLQVEPSLTQEEYEPYFLRYIALCLREHRKGEWAHDRGRAARLLGGWFRWRWRQGGGPSPQVEALKKWLADYYLTADTEIRGAVVTLLLADIFEGPRLADDVPDSPEIIAYFSDWQKDPVLAEAYAQAAIAAQTDHEPAPAEDQTDGTT